MERKMLNVKLKDTIRNTIIRQKSDRNSPVVLLVSVYCDWVRLKV